MKTITILLASFLILGQAPAQQDYPRQVTVSGIPGVIAAGAKWEMAWWGLDNADGIIGTPDGGVMFAQREVRRVRKVDPNGRTSVYLEDTGGAGGLGIDYQGRVVATLRDKPSVGILHPERKILTDSYQGEPLAGAGDLVVQKNGGLYFTESQRRPSRRVHYVAPDGKMFTFGDVNANGIQLSPDEKTLYVTDGDGIVAFDILPDGTGRNRRNFAKLQGEGVSGDGMAVDAAGRIYVSTHLGVQVISPQGQHLGTIPSPRPALNVAFSGPDKKWLFITSRGAVDAQGKEHPVSPAKTIYKISMLTQGFGGRAK